MRTLILIAFFYSLPGVAADCRPSLKVATLNLLTRLAPHALVYAPWGERADGIAAWVKRDEIEILGTQEGIDSMLADLAEKLPDFEWVGVPRSDSWFFAEFTAIFFDRTKFELLDHGNFWLSETPDEPGSSSWGSAGGFPVVFTGDLNTGESEDTLDLLAGIWQEARASSLSPPVGPYATGPFGMRLDYIFASRHFRVCAYEVPQPQTAYGRDLSDHWPVASALAL